MRTGTVEETCLGVRLRDEGFHALLTRCWFVANVCAVQVLAVLQSLPVQIRNPISQSNIEDALEMTSQRAAPVPAEMARALLASWAGLKEVGTAPRLPLRVAWD